MEATTLPVASDALATSEWLPLPTLVVSQAKEYGLLVSVACNTSSTKNSTLETPTSSDAIAARVIVPDTVAPLSGVVMAQVGAVVSGAEFCTLTAIEDRKRVVSGTYEDV